MSSGYESINKHPDPRCTRIRSVWNAGGKENGDKYRYELSTGASSGSVFCWNPLTNPELSGKILFAHITTGVQAVIDNMSVEQARTIAKANSWIAARVADDNTNNHTISVTNGPYVLQEVGVYTPDDWEHLYALYQAGKISVPWCAGPRDASAGVLGPWQL